MDGTCLPPSFPSLFLPQRMVRMMSLLLYSGSLSPEHCASGPVETGCSWEESTGNDKHDPRAQTSAVDFLILLPQPHLIPSRSAGLLGKCRAKNKSLCPFLALSMSVGFNTVKPREEQLMGQLERVESLFFLRSGHFRPHHYQPTGTRVLHELSTVSPVLLFPVHRNKSKMPL